MIVVDLLKPGRRTWVRRSRACRGGCLASRRDRIFAACTGNPAAAAEEVTFLAPAAEREFVERCAIGISGTVHLGTIDACPLVTQKDAARLLYIFGGAVCGCAGRWPRGKQAHEGFAEYWEVDAAGMDLLRRCLVLIADHELPASTYAARVTASTGASLGACILAALCTFSGPMHGSAIDYLRALLSDREVLRDPAKWPPSGGIAGRSL